jgi:hypothetical protein
MEHLQELHAYAAAAIGAITLILAYLLLRTDPEAAVPYNVAPPEQAREGWEGKVLEEPSLKATTYNGHPFLE